MLTCTAYFNPYFQILECMEAAMSTMQTNESMTYFFTQAFSSLLPTDKYLVMSTYSAFIAVLFYCFVDLIYIYIFYSAIDQQLSTYTML
jgi:uncharacterized membrane protein